MITVSKKILLNCGTEISIAGEMVDILFKKMINSHTFLIYCGIKSGKGK
jgi:hypothetical protein